MTGWVLAHDATGSNEPQMPTGQAAGYTTGSGGIAWTPKQFARHPGCVRIDQDWAASDPTADIADFEAGTMDMARLMRWCKQAQADVAAGVRTGQRKVPGVYASLDNIPPVVNNLIANGITKGIGLWVAHWGITEATAIADLMQAIGPFDSIGIQYTDNGGRVPWDDDVFDASWLANCVGGAPPPPPPPTLTIGDKGGWVTTCQHALNSHGSAPSLALDGDFGPLTLQSVQFFQHIEKITVDGIVGPVTWGKLGY